MALLVDSLLWRMSAIATVESGDHSSELIWLRFLGRRAYDVAHPAMQYSLTAWHEHALAGAVSATLDEL